MDLVSSAAAFARHGMDRQIALADPFGNVWTFDCNSRNLQFKPLRTLPETLAAITSTRY